ncbi:hypothetical protein SAMN05216412_10153 [Nitrosospira multiformis]|uniref:Uncharacterized protein n=1 Tax=Nitrosospira multiformis TaxID=1231 RepID=A0A1H9Y6M3_9PROT|nr:hypothetical protein [Nitrosospira multiformis]SES64043.1 hypothetical protein SAMN05216412_10153 [Nitrosospira multiformis]
MEFTWQPLGRLIEFEQRDQGGVQTRVADEVARLSGMRSRKCPKFALQAAKHLARVLDAGVGELDQQVEIVIRPARDVHTAAITVTGNVILSLDGELIFNAARAFCNWDEGFRGQGA